VEIPDRPIDAAVIAEAEARFRSDYFTLTGIDSTDSCTILNCWVDAVAGVAKPRAGRIATAAQDAHKGARDVWFPGVGFVPTPVYDREKLAPDASLVGPVLLEEPESTLVVPPGFALRLDAFGNVLIERSAR
jgi:N-methylhydantoinase A